MLRINLRNKLRSWGARPRRRHHRRRQTIVHDELRERPWVSYRTDELFSPYASQGVDSIV